MYLDSLFYQFPEGIEKDRYLIATYLISIPSEVEALKYAAALAVEQTTGTWTKVPGETPAVRERHLGRLVGFFEAPPYALSYPEGLKERTFVAQIAFPYENFGPSFSMMLTCIFGNISTIDNIKLMDISLPDSYLKQFKGPKFGVEGLRKLLNVYDRPMVNTMIKPCIGLNPQQTADLAYEIAVGGVDIIKDDEQTANPACCPLIERVKAVSEALKRADEIKGEETIYTFNITDRTENLRENALRAIEAGAKALMVNTWTIGLDNCRMLAEDPDINVPILSHPDLVGALYIQSKSGLAGALAQAKFPRLAGLDMYIVGAPYGKFPSTWDHYVQLCLTGLAPWQHIARTIPMIGGGGVPGHIEAYMNTYGIDIVIASGGGVIGHPMGATAGAKAFRQGIDAVVNGRTLREASEDPANKELKVAIDTWGIIGEKKKKELYDLKSNS
jgi:2,3-diketo-5-methylthiopentyl-1-phosphate enolase